MSTEAKSKIHYTTCQTWLETAAWERLLAFARSMRGTRLTSYADYRATSSEDFIHIILDVLLRDDLVALRRLSRYLHLVRQLKVSVMNLRCISKQGGLDGCGI